MAELHDTRSKALSDPDWYQGLVHVINLLQKEERVCLEELSSIDKVQYTRAVFTCIHLCTFMMCTYWFMGICVTFMGPCAFIIIVFTSVPLIMQ